MRNYTKRDIYPQDVSNAMGLIIEICGCLQNKRPMKRE